MGELMIRRNGGIPVPQYQAVDKTEKAAGSGQSQKAVQMTVTVSETLRQLMDRVSQAESHSRESRRTLQTGEAVLDEVQDCLDRIKELAKESAEGGQPDRAALQAELEKLREEIDRMLSGAAVGDSPLFVDGELAGGVQELDLEQLLEVLKRLLEQMGTELSPGQAMELLAAGSPLLALLAGMEGMNQELLMELLTALQSAEPPPEPAEGAEVPAGTVETSQAPGPASSAEYGAVRVTGQDLSGVSYREQDGVLTIDGSADVTIEGSGQTIVLAGSGRVTLQNVRAELLVVDTAEARVFSGGESEVKELDLREKTSLALDGGGLLKIGTLRTRADAALRLSGGAVVIEEERSQAALPVVVDGPVSLAMQAARVSAPDGKTLEPFDLIWKALLPGWSAVTDLELDGRQGKLPLREGDPGRLWLAKENTSGYTIHTLVVQGRDASGRPRTRYAYLHWNQRMFQEISMYPNPFDVTGGEPGRDWVYEEETHTLRILSPQVTAVSGGVGTDANQIPFSGRIVLADSIGALELSLAGVVCRVSAGRAFDLGRENDVTLVLESGTSNLFESGAGFAGISLGRGTSLSIDCTGPGGGETDGVLTATGGAGGAGIGQDSGESREQMGQILIRGASAEGQSFMGTVTIVGGIVTSTGDRGEGADITLQVGEDTVILPRFQLSAKILQLDALNVETRESARTAMKIVDADRLRVARVRAAYGMLYSQMERSFGALHRVSQYAGWGGGPMRDSDAASTLLEESILCRPDQAIQTHSRRGTEDVRQLLK